MKRFVEVVSITFIALFLCITPVHGYINWGEGEKAGYSGYDADLYNEGYAKGLHDGYDRARDGTSWEVYDAELRAKNAGYENGYDVAEKQYLKKQEVLKSDISILKISILIVGTLFVLSAILNIFLGLKVKKRKVTVSSSTITAPHIFSQVAAPKRKVVRVSVKPKNKTQPVSRAASTAKVESISQQSEMVDSAQQIIKPTVTEKPAEPNSTDNIKPNNKFLKFFQKTWFISFFVPLVIIQFFWYAICNLNNYPYDYSNFLTIQSQMSSVGSQINTTYFLALHILASIILYSLFKNKNRIFFPLGFVYICLSYLEVYFTAYYAKWIVDDIYVLGYAIWGVLYLPLIFLFYNSKPLFVYKTNRPVHKKGVGIKILGVAVFWCIFLLLPMLLSEIFTNLPLPLIRFGLFLIVIEQAIGSFVACIALKRITDSPKLQLVNTSIAIAISLLIEVVSVFVFGFSLSSLASVILNIIVLAYYCYISIKRKK